ncbi:MAG TPA: hypothetical protein VFD73_08410, partial [Gemmatimonadales bacterium]|nr:hypothetical protein [Gemmatimonadales bacterium]
MSHRTTVVWSKGWAGAPDRNPEHHRAVARGGAGDRVCGMDRRGPGMAVDEDRAGVFSWQAITQLSDH